MSAANGRSRSNALLGKDDVRALVDAMLATKPQNDVAAQLEVSAAYLNDYLHGRRAPGRKILRGLGLERVVMFRVRRNRG